MRKREHLIWLKTELSNTTPYFRRTELYQILKVELSKLGYWKQQGRGNPAKGFKKSVMAQQLAEFKSIGKGNK